MKTTRRFLLKSAVATMAFPSFLRAAAPNATVRVGVIGLRGKGKQHMQMFHALDGVEVVALCDPDESVLAQRAEDLNNPRAKTYADMRRLFDDKSIDAVVVATPNHWHALATVWACQAGKDVYVEKPVSHTLHESRLMVQAARKYGRMVQAGTQRRSVSALGDAFAQLRNGELGKIKRIRMFHYSARGSIGKVGGPQEVPACVDYDLWCGPAPKAPLMRKRLHYDWHWFWDTGNGELGNNGPHALDLARWVAGYDSLAPGVLSVGGRFGWDDNGQTPNTHIVYFDYQPAPIIAEIRNLPMAKGMKAADNYKGLRTGVMVECEGGYFSGMDGGHLYDNDGKKIRQIVGSGAGNHQANFIQAVRSRKRGDLNADIAEGHLSCGLCHQGNVSHRLADVRAAKDVREALAENTLSSDAFARMAAHLEANEIDLKSTAVRLGPALAFDVESETFVGNARANALLKRAYRAPFTMPDRV